MQIGGKLLEVIGAVLAAAETERADAALREALRDSNFSPSERATVTRLVFAYFRWLGWIDRSKSLRGQLEHVNDLVEKFASEPNAFSDAELLERAVPDWARQVTGISADTVRAFQAPPKLWLRARPGTGKELAEALGDCVEHPNVPDAIEFQGEEDLFRSAEFHAGKFELQDLSSQAVGLVCAPRPGQTWWDACAGEGGKTLHLCDLMRNQGTVWASDRAEWRLAKLKRRAARAKLFNYRVKAWTGNEHLPTKTKFDGVLVDAPCSGVGTWGRNPHARWTTTLNDVNELAEIQRELLHKISESVKPGGRVVYAVCTMTRPETSGVVEDFGRRHPEFAPIEFSSPLLETAHASTMMLFPEQVRANGMFIAAWRRS